MALTGSSKILNRYSKPLSTHPTRLKHLKTFLDEAFLYLKFFLVFLSLSTEAFYFSFNFLFHNCHSLKVK